MNENKKYRGRTTDDDLQHVLTHTIKLWEEFRNKSIFVTGGTGFIGKGLLESFLYANDRLELHARACVLTRDRDLFAANAPYIANHPSITCIQGDMVSFTFPAGDYSHIIHAATETRHDRYVANPRAAFDMIVNGMRQVLEFAKQAKTQKMLLLSSGAVYGKQPPNMPQIPESYTGAPDLGDPFAAYGEGKRVAELMGNLFARQYGTEFKIARCFAFVGPTLPLDRHFAIGNFIRDALNGGPIEIRGDGQPYRSYMYTADLMVWLWTILFRGISGRPYNVGSDMAMRIEDVARHVASEFAGGMEVSIKEPPKTPVSVERFVPDVSRARNELGLVAHLSFLDGLRRTIRNLKEERNRDAQ